MNEQPDDQNVSAPQPAESEVVLLIKKLQQQLTFLEKKIDTLITQSKQPQEKPFRSFDRPPHRGPYQDKKEFGKQKNYRDDREGGSGLQRPFKKKYEGEKREFDPKKKPFWQNRKGRG